MLQNIPTNIITGFLGVGKTSAILNVLEQKPLAEKWSVLVNEFGSIGIDGAIYAAHGVAVKEIPGGCMCCAAGVPLQVAVNRLLQATQPQRLLIEPSGLGHPQRIMDTLRGEHFQTVLDMRASICLIDPQKLLDTRYTSHQNFIDQIAIADVLVANKTDQASSQALSAFDEYANAAQPAKQLIAKTLFGKLDLNWLNLGADSQRKTLHPHYHQTQAKEDGSGSKDGFQTAGWVFSLETCFDFDCLTSCLKQIDAQRIKAVLRTDQGWFVFNIEQQQLQIQAVNESIDNRLEIISRRAQQLELEQQLTRCMI